MFRQNRGRPSLIVRLNFLLLGLGLTLYGMYGTKTRGLPHGVLAALGIEKPHQDVKMCNTRVEGVIEPDKLKLMQKGQSWVAEGPQKDQPPGNVDFVSVEKWLSRFCSAKLDAVAPTANAEAGATFAPTLFVKFIDGTIDVLRSSADGLYEWQGHTFRSDDLKNTLQDLGSLPLATQKGS